MDCALKKEIHDLRKLTTRALKDRYQELFGEPSPSSNRDHLFRRIAWRLQARAGGGLSEHALDRALLLADNCDIRLRAPRGFWQELEAENGQNRSSARDPRLPPAGTVLTRSYRGQEIVVTVEDNGLEYRGKHYRALSTIAFEVTGTRWNGFAFFGLQNGGVRG